MIHCENSAVLLLVILRLNANSSTVLQRDSVALLAFHGEPEAAGGVSRRAPLLHDRQGADGLQVTFLKLRSGDTLKVEITKST